jgi:hypothetical protein
MADVTSDGNCRLELGARPSTNFPQKRQFEFHPPCLVHCPTDDGQFLVLGRTDPLPSEVVDRVLPPFSATFGLFWVRAHSGEHWTTMALNVFGISLQEGRGAGDETRTHDFNLGNKGTAFRIQNAVQAGLVRLFSDFCSVFASGLKWSATLL